MIPNVVIDKASRDRLLGNLSVFPRRVQTKVLRVALNAWGGVVKQEEIAKAKKGPTGLLKKSPAVKVKIPDASFNAKHHGKPAYVIVGPGRKTAGVTTSAGRRLTPKKAEKHIAAGGKVRSRRPSRYAHLVEAGIAGTKHIAAAPFIEPAVRVGETAGFEKFAAKLQEGIAKEAAALPK